MHPHQDQASEPRLADDLLPGAGAIAAFVGIPERSIRYQIDRGYLDDCIVRVGRLIFGSKQALRRRFNPTEKF